MIFDTHAHYDDEAFDEDRDELLANELPKTLEKVVTIGASIRSSWAAFKLSYKYDYIYFAAGVHPENANNWSKGSLEEIEQMADIDKCVAIGEIGLDYYWPGQYVKDNLLQAEEHFLADHDNVVIKKPKQVKADDPLVRLIESGKAIVLPDEETAKAYDEMLDGAKLYANSKFEEIKVAQKKCFIEQLELAKKVNLPVAIHSRDACEDTLNILKDYVNGLDNKELSPGVIHCFSYSKEIAEIYAKLGFYIGVGGVITYSNARKLVETVQSLPLERIVIETDCPYLTPVPHRGERNDSRMLSLVVDKIAEIKGVTREEVIRVTTENAYKLYRM